MLSCFKDYKRYNDILNCILDLAWHKYMKLTLEQLCLLSALHSQYHACWCPGDFMNQGINRHNTDPQSQNIPSPPLEELREREISSLCAPGSLSAKEPHIKKYHYHAPCRQPHWKVHVPIQILMATYDVSPIFMSRVFIRKWLWQINLNNNEHKI